MATEKWGNISFAVFSAKRGHFSLNLVLWIKKRKLSYAN